MSARQPGPKDAQGIDRGILPLLLVGALLDLGLGSIFGLLAEIRGELGFQSSEIGWIAGAGFLSSVAAQLGLSRFADRGFTRSMMLVGLTAAITALLLMTVVSSFLAFFLARLLFGLGEGCFFPGARRVLIARNLDRAGELLGRLFAFQMVGFLLGPAAASLLNEWFGLRATFAALSLLMVLALWLVTRAEIPSIAPRPKGRSSFGLLGLRRFQTMLLAALGFYGSFGIFESVWPLLLSDLGASQLTIGLSLSLFSLPMVLASSLSGRLTRRWGARRVTFVALAAAAFFVGSLGSLDSMPLLALMVALFAVADAVVTPASQLAVAEATPADRIAEGQGIYSGLGMLFAAFAAPLGATVYERVGAPALFVGCALAMLTCVVLASIRDRNDFRLSNIEVD